MALTVIYASMSAGKSTDLLQQAHNHREAGLRVALLTAAVDNRSGVGVIASRLGLQQPADTFNQSTNLMNWAIGVDEADCILVDEVQFVTSAQAFQISEAAHTLAIPIRCYGLRTDFRGEPFVGMATLLSLADEIVALSTVCNCGAKTTMNERLDEFGRVIWSGNQVEIGGNNRYRAVCTACFYKHRGRQHMESSLLVAGYLFDRVDGQYYWRRYDASAKSKRPFKLHTDAVRDAWEYHHTVQVPEDQMNRDIAQGA